MKNLFRFFYQNGFVIGFIFLQIVAIWLIINYTYYQQSKLYQVSNSISGSISAKKTSITDYLNLENANKQLINENADLRNDKIESFAIVNKDYVVINDTLRRIKYRHYTAKVINSTYTKVENFITLNKGKISGFKPNMAVISTKGLVGIITSVSNNFSIVLPIIHPRSWFSVQVKHKHYFGILKWDGRDFNIAQIAEVANHAELIVGDTIETRESDIFPEGIPVGKISNVEYVEGSNFLDISVDLFVDFTSIYYVYAIENMMKLEQDSLELEGFR
jgi:rod shape-determining protein MreC